ncbi:MAG: glycosyl hydrolase [Bacteroidota bacterium]
MKKSLVFNLLLAFILIMSGCSKKQINSDVTNSADLLSQMPDPPAGYRAAPLWDWNDVITKKDIEFQMKKFKEGGIGGVFIHPRPGLVTEYLSEDWNQLFKYTVEIAKELGMQVWIYDENSYPSGFAGGHVQARFPDSYKHGTGLGYKITNTLADTAGLEIEVILQKTASGFKTIFSSTSSTISTSSSDSTLYLFYRTHPSTSFWFGGFPYVDLLYPGVTDTFMKATMEGYEKYNKEDFGNTLKGIFTDEPNLSAAEGPGTVVRWTPDLFEQFEKRWGYLLQPTLASLVEETGDWMKVRHDYFTLTLEMFLDRWAVPWFNYCEKNNLDWTGHYWEHGWPYPGEGIDEAAFYMYHQIPGVDMLGRSYDPEGFETQFGNIRAVRELGSSANQAGWRRTLSETWGGAGWQISFAEMKRLVDWEVVMGVNFVNPHLSYYSMQGVRKFDYPPSFNYQEPWWDNFSLLGDYVGRICLAMSAGEQFNNTLVLQPNTTAWMYHSSTKDHPAIFNLSRTFKKFIGDLEANQYEYDLGSEQVLKRFADVTRNGLTIRNRTYNHIVIPPGMRNIESTTLSMLEKYLDAGLTILCLSDSVDYIDGKPNASCKELAEKYPVTWIEENNLYSDHVISFFANPDFVLIQKDTTKGQVFHQRRMLEDGELLFVVNSDLESPATAEVTIAGRNAIEINLLTGKPLPINLTKQPTKIVFSCYIPAGGSRLFLITGKKIKTDPSKLSGSEIAKSLSPVGKMTVKRLSSNVLTIDYLDRETTKQTLNDT